MHSRKESIVITTFLKHTCLHTNVISSVKLRQVKKGCVSLQCEKGAIQNIKKHFVCRPNRLIFVAYLELRFLCV